MFRCLALPFGWGRSRYLIVKLMRPFERHHLKEKLGWRSLSYMDEFLLAPSLARVVSTARHCQVAQKEPGATILRLEIELHRGKGC